VFLCLMVEEEKCCFVENLGVVDENVPSMRPT
jgi:hypothetical protein